MFTMEINGITVADGLEPLLASDQTARRDGRAIYTKATLGVIDPNVFFQDPAQAGSLNPTTNGAGFRMDVAFAQQSGVAVAGSLAIVDLLTRELVGVLDLTVTADVAELATTFPVPPGYMIQVTSDTLTSLLLSFTQLPSVGDVAY